MRKKIIVGILTVLLMAPMMTSQINRQTKALDIPVMKQTQTKGSSQNPVRIICYVGGQGGMRHSSVLIPEEDAILCHSVFHQLIENMTRNPLSDHTQKLKEEFIGLLARNHLIPAGVPLSRYSRLLNPPWVEALIKHHVGSTRVSSPIRSGVASALICDMSSEGSGVLFPFIMLPRPRFVAVWSSPDGTTAVGKFLSIGGFTAKGQQFGTALGFWGIGVAFAFPEGNIYSFLGYSLFVTVNAADIESYPPNQPPVITGTDPVDNEQNVPVSLPQLSFSISDPDGDLMNYTLTTFPDIGSGSGNQKPGGTYSVPVHGLQALTQYSWTIAVSDALHTTEQTFRFTTRAVGPVVSDPVPADGEGRVPTDIQQLSFTLTDFQGDAMNYTVESSPFIGSGSGTNVHNGTYSVPVSGLQNLTTYRWFVNVTDGVHWTRKTFTFQTRFPSHFDPFAHGWLYRKQITVDHTKVSGDLTDFPVLVSTVDSDLKVKAQADGDDILFMNSTGVATLLNYEIEQYDGATGTLVAWVNISQLSSQDDTIFYMYYGNPNTISLQNPEKTWDSHYLGVWHMNDATSTTIADSTAGAHTGEKNSVGHPMETPSGKVGKAQNFVPDDGITMANSDVFTMNDGTHDVPFTLEVWIYPTMINNHHTIIAKDGQNRREWYLQLYGYESYPRFIYMLLIDNNNQKYIEDKYYYNFQENVWYQITVTYDGSQSESGLILYFNGVPTAWSETNNNGYGMMRHTTVPLFMGKYDWTGANAKYWYGIMDEVRISKGITRSPDWISTSYKNQNDPGSFVLIGPEVPGP